MTTSESVGGLSEPVAGSRASTTAGYRDAWLMVLEKEGLRAALAQVRQFEPGGQPREGSSQGDARAQARTGLPESPQTAQPPMAEAPKLEASFTRASVADRLPAAMAVTGSSRAQPLPGAAPFELYTKAVADVRAQRVEGRPAVATLPTKAPEEIKPSRLTIINGEAGTEVWVRDAAMNAGEGRLLRTRISDALAVLGARIKRFSLNGKTIYQADRVATSTPRDSEK